MKAHPLPQPASQGKGSVCPASPTWKPPSFTASPTTRSLSLLQYGTDRQHVTAASVPGGQCLRAVQPQSKGCICAGRRNHQLCRHAFERGRCPARGQMRPQLAKCQPPAELPNTASCRALHQPQEARGPSSGGPAHPMPTARPRSCLCEPAANCSGPRPSGTGTSGTQAVTVLSLPRGQ